jgi:hypothetical protein
MPRDDDITLTLPKTEALALAKVAEYGIQAAETFNLIQSLGAASSGLRTLKAAIDKQRAK